MSPMKFLRQYEKWIISVGMTLLMVAFLIQPTLTAFGPNPEKQEIGTTRHGKITMGDQRVAQSQMDILRRLSSLLMVDFSEREDGLAWALITQDARAMGLAASDFEIELTLRNMGFKEGSQDRELRQVANRLSIPIESIQDAIRSWLIVQSYRELSLGLGRLSSQDRVQLIAQVSSFMQQGMMDNPMIRQLVLRQVFQALEATKGTPRLSQPVLKRMLFDQRSAVKVAIMPVDARRFLDATPEPSEQDLQALFDRFKDQLPGQGDPYGFGYKQPARVKIEYLAIPWERLLGQSQVDEADAVAQYDANPQRYTVTIQPPETPADTQPATQPAAPVRRQQSYEEVRLQIIAELRRKQAVELGQKMVKAAQAMLQENLRAIPQSEGYRVLPEDFMPVALAQVADKLQQQFKVRPDVVKRDEAHLSRNDLTALPGIGQSVVGQGVPFVEYVMSARELPQPSESNLATLRLQVGVPSQPLVGNDQSLFIFRLTDAKAANSPASLDEVREKVKADAKLLAAYKKLVADAASWKNRAVAQGLPELAKSLGVSVLEPPPFPRREFRGNALSTPEVQGVGSDAGFVDQIFEIAMQASANAATGPGKPEDRFVAAAVDGKLTLFVTRIEQFRPMTETDFEQNLASLPFLAPQLNTLLLEPYQRGKDNPLSLKAIQKRVGFKPARGFETEESTSNATATEPAKS